MPGSYVRTQKHREQSRKNAIQNFSYDKTHSQVASMKRKKSLIGRIFSPEHRRKLSMVQKIIGKRPYIKLARRLGKLGKSLSIKTRKKISNGRVGKCCGSNNPNWKGGIDTRSAEYARKLYHKNPYPKRFRNQIRQSRFRAGGLLCKETLQMVYEDNIKKYGTLTCDYCLKKIEFGKDSIDHKIPLSRGGTNRYENLTIACRPCNSKKSIKPEGLFRKESHYALSD